MLADYVGGGLHRGKEELRLDFWIKSCRVEYIVIDRDASTFEALGNLETTSSESRGANSLVCARDFPPRSLPHLRVLAEFDPWAA